MSRSRTHAQLCRLSPPPHSSSSGFRDFLLKPDILRAIVDCGFEHPSQGETQLLPYPFFARVVAASRVCLVLSLNTAAGHHVSSVVVWLALVVSMQCLVGVRAVLAVLYATSGVTSCFPANSSPLTRQLLLSFCFAPPQQRTPRLLQHGSPK